MGSRGDPGHNDHETSLRSNTFNYPSDVPQELAVTLHVVIGDGKIVRSITVSSDESQGGDSRSMLYWYHHRAVGLAIHDLRSPRCAPVSNRNALV